MRRPRGPWAERVYGLYICCRAHAGLQKRGRVYTSSKQCSDRTFKAFTLQGSYEFAFGARPALTQALLEVGGRVTLELNVQVTNRSRLVTQPTKVILQDAPTAQGEPDA
jgi:hypothetical protein